MRLVCAFLVIVAASTAAARAAGKDEDMDFLHRMVREGFADIAVDYLRDLKINPAGASPSIMRVWDLEMSKSLRAQAQFGSYNAAQAKQLLGESKALLEQFVKNNPNLPEAIQAAAEWTKEQANDAQYALYRALALTDKAKREAALAKVRESFEKVRNSFERARDAALAVQATLTYRASGRQKQEACLQVAESRLNLAEVDFDLALAQPTKKERDARFGKVAKEFENIYREYNEDQENYVAVEAHYGSARILQELGRNDEARDCYQEVLANDTTDVPDATLGEKQPVIRRAAANQAPDWSDKFYSDVERHYLKVLYAVDRDGENGYYREFDRWRKLHASNREKCAEFQGLTLDWARHLIDAVKDAKSDVKKQEYKRQALRMLDEVVKVPSPYQADAVELRRQLNPKAAAEDLFGELLIDADKAAASKDWTKAAELFGRALAAATPKTDKTRVAEARNAYVACVHNQAVDLYNRKRLDEAVETIVKLLGVPENRRTAAAPPAALFALRVLYSQLHSPPFAKEEDKQANEKMMARVAAFARHIIDIREWTAKEEADSARIILMQVALAKCDAAELRSRESEAVAAAAKAKFAGAKDKNGPGAKTGAAAAAKAEADARAAASEAGAELAEADRVFKEINPDSHKYPEALMVLGWKHWHKYRVAKRAWEDKHPKDPPDKAAKASLDDDRKQALKYTQEAVERLAGKHNKDAPMADELREAKVFLAELFLEGNKAKTATGHYKELLDDILADPAVKFSDATALRIFNGAEQAFMQLGDLQSASAAGMMLLQRGPDVDDVNTSIINFVKRLQQLRKQGPAEDEAAREPVDPQDLVDLEGKILIGLAKRQNVGGKDQLANNLVWVAKSLSQLGTDDADAAATELVKKIIDRAQNDDEFDKQVGKYMSYLRSLSFSLDAKHGDYEKANDEVKAPDPE